MATHINDLKNAVELVQAFPPDDISDTTTGPAVAMDTGDGPCFAIQSVGEMPGDGTLDGHIEESANGTSGWSAISGATFTQVDSSHNLQVIRFYRKQRYLRWVGTLGGSSPEFIVGVLIGEENKTI